MDCRRTVQVRVVANADTVGAFPGLRGLQKKEKESCRPFGIDSKRSLVIHQTAQCLQKMTSHPWKTALVGVLTKAMVPMICIVYRQRDKAPDGGADDMHCVQALRQSPWWWC